MKSHILQLAANIIALSAMNASAAIHYVNVNSTSPTVPYTNCATASTNIHERRRRSRGGRLNPSESATSGEAGGLAKVERLKAAKPFGHSLRAPSAIRTIGL